MSSPVPIGASVYTPKVRQEAIVRRQISRYTPKTIGIQVQNTAGLMNADTGTMTLALWLNTTFDPNALDGTEIVSASETNGILKESTGIYTFAISAQYTQIPGLMKAVWQYKVNGDQLSFSEYYEIIDPMPEYDGLSDAQKMCVEQTQWMIGDLYDTTDGGPHLLEEFQTHFGYNRLAQLLMVACNRINQTSQPLTNFVVGERTGSQFPETYVSLLQLGLYIEVVKHLVRSYTEQPVIQGGPGVAFLDRRDYADRWRSVLRDESDDWKHAVRLFKRKQLGLGSGSLLVSGGIFGSSGRRFVSGGYAAATRAMRFYPVTFVSKTG